MHETWQHSIPQHETQHTIYQKFVPLSQLAKKIKIFLQYYYLCIPHNTPLSVCPFFISSPLIIKSRFSSLFLFSYPQLFLISLMCPSVALLKTVISAPELHHFRLKSTDMLKISSCNGISSGIKCVACTRLVLK